MLAETVADDFIVAASVNRGEVGVGEVGLVEDDLAVGVSRFAVASTGVARVVAAKVVDIRGVVVVVVDKVGEYELLETVFEASLDGAVTVDVTRAEAEEPVEGVRKVVVVGVDLILLENRGEDLAADVAVVVALAELAAVAALDVFGVAVLVVVAEDVAVVTGDLNVEDDDEVVTGFELAVEVVVVVAVSFDETGTVFSSLLTNFDFSTPSSCTSIVSFPSSLVLR